MCRDRSNEAAKRLLRAAVTLGIVITPFDLRAEEPERVRAELSYAADLLANVSGGLEAGQAWLGRADLTVEADGEAVGWDEAKLVIGVIYTHGPDFSGTRVGDAQVVSNIQGDGILRPYEAYADFPLNTVFSGKFGFVDLNTEFDVQRVGAFFSASPHGIGTDFAQSGANGPSIFPVTSLSAILRWEKQGWSVRAGVFNAVSGDPEAPRRFPVTYLGADGLLLVGEMAAPLAPDVRLKLGVWGYSSPEPVVASPEARAKGNKGAYGQVEGTLVHEHDDDKLESWVRLGAADPTSNRVTLYAGGGVTYGSEKERVGIAVAHARQSEQSALAFSS